MRTWKRRTWMVMILGSTLIVAGSISVRLSHQSDREAARDSERVEQILMLSALAPKVQADMDRSEVRAILLASGYQELMTEYNDRFVVGSVVLRLDPYGKLMTVGPDWQTPPPWRR